ncbi:MAG: DUF1194 domain-containing protein, partial [Rhizobiales bacterium]|nr:DUF1194 domain-containing protein [Hyphomicrobiales bacterium]
LCLEADCSGRPVSYNLEEAFLSQIIGGPGSFVITVDGRKSFARAVRRKLILEISDCRHAINSPLESCRQPKGLCMSLAGDKPIRF